MEIAGSSVRGIRWAGAAAMLGGILWVPYGIWEMLEPWGPDVLYRDDLGYAEVIDPVRFVIYSLPGSLALVLTTLGLFGVLALLRLPLGPITRAARVLATLALVLAVVSLVGVIVQFDPFFTAGRVFGSVALAAATMLTGIDASRAGTTAMSARALLALGLLGLFLFPLWPLVYALQWVPQWAGAAIIALFGLGWFAAGVRLGAGTRRRAK